MSIKRIGDHGNLCDAVVHNGLAYLAGHVADDPVSPSVYEQTKNILKQIDETLAQAGTDKSKILKANIWLADISTFAEMNRPGPSGSPRAMPRRAPRSNPSSPTRSTRSRSC
jgi:enamine deaminase RidA (YjgF/YER057c/UK114 family)